MDALLKEEQKLLSDLQDVIKREEVLIVVLTSLSGEDADDMEQELREIREERQGITHKLNLVRSKIKTGTM